jgi:hypothetical protein
VACPSVCSRERDFYFLRIKADAAMQRENTLRAYFIGEALER